MTVVAALQPQDIHLIQHQSEPEKMDNQKDLPSPVALIKTEINKDPEDQASISIPTHYLQTANFQEYIQKMQSTTVPLSLQQFLKFNTAEIKRETITDEGIIETVSFNVPDTQLLVQDVGEMENEESIDDPNDPKKKKKKYKKKPPKPKKPKPGKCHLAVCFSFTEKFITRIQFSYILYN